MVGLLGWLFGSKIDRAEVSIVDYTARGRAWREASADANVLHVCCVRAYNLILESHA